MEGRDKGEGKREVMYQLWAHLGVIPTRSTSSTYTPRRYPHISGLQLTAGDDAMASLFSSKLTSAYTALRGDLGTPQSPTSTIDKLVDRIQTSPSVDDRRTAVLGLKGCIREFREIVGERALESLVAVLRYDAPNDAEIAKAVLETLMGLMEVQDGREGGRVVEEWFKVSSGEVRRRWRPVMSRPNKRSGMNDERREEGLASTCRTQVGT
jgi:hypothetical protein